MVVAETLTSQTAQVVLKTFINQPISREHSITICDNTPPSTGMPREVNLILLLIVNVLIYTVNLRTTLQGDSVEKCVL